MPQSEVMRVMFWRIVHVVRPRTAAVVRRRGQPQRSEEQLYRPVVVLLRVHLALNMFCQQMYPWMDVVPAADLCRWRTHGRPEREAGRDPDAGEPPGGGHRTRGDEGHLM